MQGDRLCIASRTERRARTEQRRTDAMELRNQTESLLDGVVFEGALSSKLE